MEMEIDKFGRLVLPLTGCGLTSQEWITRSASFGFECTKWARDVLNKPDYDAYHRLECGKIYKVALIPSKGIADENLTTAALRKTGESYYGQSPFLRAELAFLLREAISDDQLKDWKVYFITAFHEPIFDSYGQPCIFQSERRGSGNQINVAAGEPRSRWSRLGVYAFPLSN